jgi:hypothetical protein
MSELIANRYTFQKRGKTRCPNCGKKTFVPLVDTQTNQVFEHLGKCDRYNNCGYKNYKVHDEPSFQIAERVDYDTIEATSSCMASLDLNHVLNSMKYFNLEDNDLLCFLVGLFGKERVERAKEEYLIGTSKQYPRAAVFWYVSLQFNNRPVVHFGKIMKYNPETGKRLKEANSVGSVNRMIKDDRPINPSLFGVHLAQRNTTAPVYVVESEKTAIIASLFYPSAVWVATGSLQNLKPSRFHAIANREIVLIPDSGGYKYWHDKSKSEFVRAGIEIEQVLNLDHWPEGHDIADILIELHRRKIQQASNILEAMANSTVNMLISC